MEIRLRKGWSRLDLARRARVAFKTIQAIEEGRTEQVRMRTCRSMARAMGVALEEMQAILGFTEGRNGHAGHSRDRFETVMARVIARMKANPVPLKAPRFTRDELYEDR